MPVQKFKISCDKNIYEAWPDVILLNNGKMICAFNECTHHADRTYSRVMLTESFDHGKTWTPKHPLSESTEGLPYFYDVGRLALLKSGKIVFTVSRCIHNLPMESETTDVIIFESSDNGETWSDPIITPLKGLVPDKLTELDNGRLLLSAHRAVESGRLVQYLIYSDDSGDSWSPEIVMADDPRYDLCEVSMLPLGNGTIVSFFRVNNGCVDCQKVISHDNGETWSELIPFPIPGCHRPSAGFLQDGRILITCRLYQGGAGWFGNWTQNTIAVMTDKESALADNRKGAATRILPLDFDRSPVSDTGYTGWVQFPDQEIYVVNYIVDDKIDKAQIRGYSLSTSDFLLETESISSGL